MSFVMQNRRLPTATSELKTLLVTNGLSIDITFGVTNGQVDAMARGPLFSMSTSARDVTDLYATCMYY